MPAFKDSWGLLKVRLNNYRIVDKLKKELKFIYSCKPIIYQNLGDKNGN